VAITFSVPGEPVPQPRPRVSTRGGFARAYVPAKHPVHAYRHSLAAAARDAGVTQTDEPLSVVIDATNSMGPDRFTSTGTIEGRPHSRVILSYNAGFLHASIQARF